MKTLDGRKLNHEALEAIRIRAVLQVERGESPETVIKSLGMDRSCIYKWIAKYREGGLGALKAKKLLGRPLTLKGPQLRWIYKTITNKNPVQLQFPYALWTREMVRELIENKYGITISAVSVGRLLKKLGLSCQKPLMRAFQQDPVVTQEWVDKVYPKIKKEAKKEKAEIFFGDEAGVRSDYHGGTTWGVKGQTPIISTTGARFSLNMLSAVSAQGGMRFMTHKGKVNSAVFCDFLNRLMHNAKNKIFLILDGHPVHKSLKVKKFIESTGGRLRIYYLPSYSPELNPDEQVWNNVKGKIGRSTIKGPDDLNKKVRGHLISLQRNPEKVRMFFQEPNVKYAA